MTEDPKSAAESASNETTNQAPTDHQASTEEVNRKPVSIKIGSQREAGAATESNSAESAMAKPVAPQQPPVEASNVDVAEETQDPSADGSATSQQLDTERNARSARARRLSSELVEEINDALGGLSLDQLMNESSSDSSKAQQLELDQRCRGTVIKIDRDSAFFNLGVQDEGIVSLRQFGDQLPEIGMQMDVVPTKFLREESLYELVVPGASVAVQDWSDLAEGVVVEAKITGHNKGGLECEVNRIRGFIPISQISLYRVEDLEPYVGQALQCVVNEANPDRGNLVLSHRAILEREKEQAREQLLEALEVGQIREGVVRRIQDFGAFVDIGGVDGLVHISQLSWDRINHPSEVVEEGQDIRVRIEKIDPATGKIGLSYRELLEHPWQDVDEKYPVGEIVDGTVSKIMQFGAFVRIASGIEGLVHISELAHHRVQRVSSVVQEGNSVQVKVLSVDPDAQKISLSMKAVTGASPAANSAEDETESDEVEATPVKRRIRDEQLKGGLKRDSGGEQFGLKW